MSFTPREIRIAPDGRARKAVLVLRDGKAVETVLLKPSPQRWTACLSTQVGCAFGCAFCATGLMGLERDMTGEEISDQVLFWRQHMRRELFAKLADEGLLPAGWPRETVKEFAGLAGGMVDVELIVPVRRVIP